MDGVLRRKLEELDPRLLGLARRARLLPALVAENAASERARVLAALSRGEPSEPRWTFRREAPSRAAFSALEDARRLAEALPGALGAAYLARLDELELDLWILEALADPRGTRRARALGARRFGTAHQPVDGTPLDQIARRWLERLRPGEEERRLEASEVARALAATARAAGLAMSVKIEPRLAAGAATGEHTIFVADRRFGARERVRLCAHEVLGHAVVGHNARCWPVGLFVAGTAGAFADQEGLALCLEEEAGVLDAERRRTLALRVLAASWAEDGAGFVETVRRLTGTHGLSAPAAVSIAERSARGSGVARDVGYLAGYLRVAALRDGSPAGFAELREARLSIEARLLLRADGIAPHGPRIAPTIDAIEAGTASERRAG